MLDSVKKAFVLSIKALKLFYVLAAVNIIAGIANLLIIPAPVDAEMTTARSFVVIGLALLLALLGIFLYGGSLAYIKDLIKTGSAGIGSFVDNGKKYFLRLLLISIIIAVVSLIVGILLFLVLGVLPVALKWILGALVWLALVILIIILPPYAAVGSDLRTIQAIKKAFLVAKNNFLKMLVILIIMLLVTAAVYLIATLITGIFTVLFRPISRYIAAVIMAIANPALTILANIAFMDFYLKNTEGTA